MSDTYRQKLSIRINLATTALRNHQPNEPTQSKKPTDHTFRILQHITTLLTTGTPKGPANDPTVIALTANFQSDGIKSLVFVTQNTRDELSPKIMSLESDLKGENVLRQWEQRDKTLEVHFKKLFAIIDMFRQISANPSVSSVKPPTLPPAFSAAATPTEHPMHIFARDLGGLFDRLAYPKILNIRYSMVRTVLRDEYNIDATPTESGKCVYTVTRSNIADWVHAFIAIFERLKGSLIEAGKCKKSVTRDDVIAAAKHSIYFHELLTSGLVSFLLADPLFSAGIATKRARGHATIPLIPEAEDEDEDEDASTVPDVDTPDHEVLRYLKTITAWTAAVESLTADGTLPTLPIHAHLFSAPHPIIENLDQHISDFKASILTQFRDMEDKGAVIKVALEQRLKPCGVRRATLHAEALAMALASCFSSPGGVEAIENTFKISKNDCKQILCKVFDTPESKIAVSRKCCWSCWRLYCHWNPHESATPENTGSPEPGPNIALLGSHSTIFPWCPPPIGLPIVFLESMAKELEEMLVRVLKDTTEWEGQKSGQSSPQSTIGDLRDLDDEWDNL